MREFFSASPTIPAGYEGIATLLELTRSDDTLDYGYLAVVRGHPNAKEDNPDLMLYVIRYTKNAKAKGIEPIGKEAFNWDGANTVTLR